MKLYHLTNVDFDAISDDVIGCVQGGIFAAERDRIDTTYGNIIYEITANRVAYPADIDINMIVDEIGRSWAFADVVDKDELAHIIINDNVHALFDLCIDIDANDAAWEMQRILGSVARAQGFDAVEVCDGYFCFSTCGVKRHAALKDIAIDDFLEKENETD